MRRCIQLIILICIMTVLMYGQQGPPSGYIPPVSMAGMGPNGAFAYFGANASGSLITVPTTGILTQIGGYIPPMAPVAQDSNGLWHYLQVDNNGALKIVQASGGVSAASSLISPYAGQPIFGSTASGIGTSASWIDATFYPGADACAKINAALTIAAGLGLWVDARGFTGKQVCNSNPIPSNASGVLLLGPAVFYAQTAWINTNRFAVIGSGWESNPPTSTPTGTTISACSAINAFCGAVFPAGIGGAITCIGDGNGTCRTSKNAAPPLFDSYFDHITVDGDGVPGAICGEDFNGNENSGYRFSKFMNCLKGIGRGILIAGSNFQGTFNLTGGLNTFSGTGFQSDMIGSQYKFPGSTDPTTNYLVTTINAGGTAGTLDVPFAGVTISTPGTINNANTQNGSLWGLYFVSLPGKCNDTTSTGGRSILMNTGSGSNKGPREIGDITAVDGCADVNQPTTQLDISGAALRIDTVHMESCKDCLLLGANSATNSITVLNPDAGSIANTVPNGSVWKISNNFASEHITVLETKAIPCSSPCMLPTNLYVDQINGNTMATSTKTIEALYAMSNGTVITTAQTIPIKVFGVIINGGVINAGNGLVGTPSINLGDATTGFFRPASNTIGVSSSGTENVRFISTGIKIAGGNCAQFASGVIANASDAGLCRAGASIAQLSDGAANANGFLKNLGTVRVINDVVLNADTALHVITGLSWTIPNTIVAAFRFKCDLIYSQATAAVLDAFGVQVTPTNPTSIVASANVQLTVGPPSTYTSNSISLGATNVATNILTFTPGAITTNYNATITGTWVNPVNTTNTLQIMALTGAAADALTIRAGSSCDLWVTSN